MTGRLVAPLQLEELTLDPGGEWTAGRGMWQMALVSSGFGYWMSSDLRSQLAPNDALIIGPEATGTVRASQIGPVALQFFCFFPDQLWGIFTLLERRFFECDAIGKDAAKVRIVPASHLFSENFKDLVRRRRALSPLAQRLRALELVAEAFSEQLARQVIHLSNTSSGRDRFNGLISRLTDHELLNHRPEDLASLCGCSPRHFSRLFRAEFGLSIRERQGELRLAKAKALLVASNDKLMDISRSCGFGSLGHFTSAFKKRVGVTPSAWRKSALRERVTS